MKQVRIIIYRILSDLKEQILDEPFTPRRSLMVEDLDRVMDEMKKRSKQKTGEELAA